MTEALVRKGVFRERPVTIIDVGARGGVESLWEVFGQDVRIIGFELDPEECERLNREGDSRVQYMPVALAGTSGPRPVYVTSNSLGTSLYKPDLEYNARHLSGSNLEIVGQTTVETTTLSTLPPADFIKLDAEGAELEILQGATLDETLGFVTEVRMSRALNGSPAFWELDRFSHEQGFDLYDLDVYRIGKKALPYPFLYSNYDAAGKPYPGFSVQGQVLCGDALYFRDLAQKSCTPRQALVLACLFEIFGLNDCAAELILACPAAFDSSEELLDLLVPEVKGVRLSYRDYIGRDFIADPLFRPTRGKRYPESIISHYDGVFTPSWHARRSTFGRKG